MSEYIIPASHYVPPISSDEVIPTNTLISSNNNAFMHQGVSLLNQPSAGSNNPGNIVFTRQPQSMPMPVQRSTSTEPMSLQNLSVDMRQRIAEAEIRKARQKLINSVSTFQDNTPPLNQLLQIDFPIESKLGILDLKSLLFNNCKEPEKLHSLVLAFSILEKYGKNLLKPAANRPQFWKSIKFANGKFKEYVNTIVGSKDILKKFGYAIEIEDGLTFPDDLEPNVEHVASLLADLLISKNEIEAYRSGSHPHPRQIECVIPLMARILPSNDVQTDNPPAVTETGQTIRNPPTTVQFMTNYTPTSTIRLPPSPYTFASPIVPNMPHIRPSVRHSSPTSFISQPRFGIPQQGGFNVRQPPVGALRLPGMVPGEQVGLNAMGQKSERFSSAFARASVAPRTQITSQQGPALYENVENEESLPCDICGNSKAKQKCQLCIKILCEECDGRWHTHPKRRSHKRVKLRQKTPPPATNEPSKISPSEIQTDAVPYSPVPAPRTKVDSTSSQNQYENVSPFGIPQSQLNVAAGSQSQPGVAVHVDSFDQISDAAILKMDISQLTNLKSYIAEKLKSLEIKLNDIIVNDPLFFENKDYMTLTTEKDKLIHSQSVANGQLKRLESNVLQQSESASMPTPLQTPEQDDFRRFIKYPPASYQPGSAGMIISSSGSPTMVASVLSLPAANAAAGTSLDSGIGQTIRPKASNAEPQARSQQHGGMHRICIICKRKVPDDAKFCDNCGRSSVIAPVPQKTCINCNVTLSADARFCHYCGEQVTTVPNTGAQLQQAPDHVRVLPSQQFQSMPTVVVTTSMAGPGNNQPLTRMSTSASSMQTATHTLPRVSSTPSQQTSATVQTTVAQTLPRVSSAPGQSVHTVNSSRNASASVVEQEWGCEHCTFRNAPFTRICTVCDKTSDNPILFETPMEGPQLVLDLPARGISEPDDDHEYEVFEQNVVYEGDGSQAAAAPPIIGSNKIVEEHDRIYWEKKEAHEKYKKQLEEQEKQGEASPSVTTESELLATIKPFATPENQSSVTPKEQTQPMSLQPQMAARLPPDGARSLSPVMRSNLQDIEDTKSLQELYIQGRSMLRVVRGADMEGFDMDELELALKKCSEPKHAVEWLKKDWKNTIETVVVMVTAHGQGLPENVIGQLSEAEAKEALLECDGNVETACQLCIEERKEKFEGIARTETYEKHIILDALFHNKGDVEETLKELNCESLYNFLDGIWNGALRNGDEGLDVFTSNDALDENVRNIIQDKAVDVERRMRMLYVECRLQGWGRAENVLKILDGEDLEGDVTLEEIIEAVKNCGDVQSSRTYLQQECLTCFMKYPMNKIRKLMHCQCGICVECMTQYFEVVIKEKHVKDFVCPACQLPDIDDEELSETHLNFLDMMLNTLVAPNLEELFQQKLRDWHLMKDPNFRWCSHCDSGFIFGARNQLKMTCPHCKKFTCFSCKKPWLDQHTGLTCEEFQTWKETNDPALQAAGLAKHLEQNGIDCPGCHFRYALARGGCMHFTCTQCRHEFCAGCNQSFKRGQKCGLYRKCASSGLHCHHPRDCLFYLRDFSVDKLQKLLLENNVPFNKDPPEGEDHHERCPVMEQKENVDGLKDEPCGREIPQHYAGLCRIHYVEYLVGLINSHQIDPVVFMDIDQLKNQITKVELNEPKRAKNETNDRYRKKLIDFIKERIPLKALRKQPRKQAVPRQNMAQPAVLNQAHIAAEALYHDAVMEMDFGNDADTDED